MTTWNARIIRCSVHDGDTLTNCSFDIGWHAALMHQSVRLTSSVGPINAPEVTGVEATAGQYVRRWFAAQLGRAKGPKLDLDWLDISVGGIWIVSHELSKDVYGRTIGEIRVNDVDIGKLMLEKGFAKSCRADGKRIPFTEQELAAITGKFGYRL